MSFKNLYPYIIVCLLAIGLPISATGLKVKNFTFSHFGTLEGLSSQRVYSLHKSKDNAVWWTTKHGIDRTNGVVVSNYSLGETSPYSSFAGRVVKFAHSTNNDDEMYVFDNSGRIYQYNKIQDRFDFITDVSKTMNIPVMLSDVLVTHDGMWLAMREGVYQLLPSDGYKLKDMGIRHFSDYVLPWGNDELLFCTHDGVFDRNGKKLFDDNVISGYYDAQTSCLWLGTFGKGVKVIKNVSPIKVNSEAWEEVTLNIPTNPVRVITPYDGRTMLIGIDGFGVYQALRIGGSASPLFSANEGTDGVLHGNGVYDIVVDTWSNIFVASYSGGIDMARPAGSTTAVFHHVMNNPQSIINDHVNCVASNDNELLLMGTDDGVSIYNTQTETWKHAARGMVVLDVCKKPDGKLLLATYGNGVCEVSPNGTTRLLYSTADGTLKDDHVFRLRYDKAGNLWMGTLFGSLTVKTPEGNKYFSVDNILALTPLSDGKMAIGSAHGLYLVSLNDEQPKMIEYMPEDKTDANRYVNDIFEDRNGRLWIATDGGGVYIFDRKTWKVTHQLSTAEGMPSNIAMSITKDQAGRIWIATEKGLVFVNPEHPTEIINVSYCYGLNTEYVQHAVAKMPNGDIVYGTVDGVVVINPKNITRLNYQARLTIKGVHVHTEGSAKEEDPDAFRQKIADGLSKGEIRLSYNERSFDILFESINLRNYFDIGYQYRIEGMEWSQTFTQQFIGFENLEPGKHVLQIRSISKTSGIVLDEKEVVIYIGQPWWNSWWMWCIYALLLILAFQGVWQMYNLHSKYLRHMMDRVAVPDDNVKTTSTKVDKVADHSIDTDVEEEESDSDDAPTPVKREGVEFVEKATNITLDNLKDTNFTIDNLCREMGMSRTLFYVKLKTYTGKSPQDFVRTIRLERASSLLRQGRTVTEVSVLTGFDNPKYFSTVFKKYFGISPSKY